MERMTPLRVFILFRNFLIFISYSESTYISWWKSTSILFIFFVDFCIPYGSKKFSCVSGKKNYMNLLQHTSLKDSIYTSHLRKSQLGHYWSHPVCGYAAREKSLLTRLYLHQWMKRRTISSEKLLTSRESISPLLLIVVQPLDCSSPLTIIKWCQKPDLSWKDFVLNFIPTAGLVRHYNICFDIHWIDYISNQINRWPQQSHHLCLSLHASLTYIIPCILPPFLSPQVLFHSISPYHRWSSFHTNTFSHTIVHFLYKLLILRSFCMLKPPQGCIILRPYIQLWDMEINHELPCHCKLKRSLILT